MPDFMNSVPTWRRVAASMSLRERGAYASMLAWIVDFQQPLPGHFDVLCGLIGVGNRRPDREAVAAVLERFGVAVPGGWMLAEAQAEIEVTASVSSALAVTRDRSRIRRARCRDIAKKLRDGLRELGVDVPWDASMKTLRALGAKHGVSWAGAGSEKEEVKAPVTRDRTVTVTPVTRAATPYEVLGVSSLRSETPNPSLGALGAVAMAMRAEGLADAHPGHETLRELVAAGVAVEDFALVAAEAVVKGKRFAWALATLKGRRADAARGSAAGPSRPGRRDHEAELREWAPLLVSPSPSDADSSHGMAPPLDDLGSLATPVAKIGMTRSNAV